MDAPLGNNCKDTAPTLGAFLFCGAFALYLFTLAPTVTFWDSGELIAASHLLGISHQPGYPLYCILGKGFSLLLPVGSNAFRLNLMSAAFSALTAFVVYKAVLALLDDRAESVAGRLAAPVAASLAFLMAASRTFWSQAVVAEVYALNSFFLALLVLMHVYSRQGRIGAARYVRLSGFVFGLGVVNHVSLAVYLPALALSWGLAPRDENLDEGPCGRITPYLQGVFFALLGLSVFFYLPVRSAAGAGLDIGHPDTWGRFLWVVKWHDYGSLVRHLPGLVSGYISGLVSGSGISVPAVLGGALAALILAWRLFRDGWKTALPLLVFLVLYLLVVAAQAAGAKGDERFGLAAKFYIPALVAGTVLAGMLIADVLRHPGGGAPAGQAFAALTLAALLFASGVLVYRNLAHSNLSGSYLAYDYAKNSLDSVDDGGVLLTWGDNGVFPLWYLRLVERYRDDTALVHTPLMTYDWYLGDVEGMLGRDAGFMKPYFLGENAYRIYKAVTPARRMAYDYSAARFLKLDIGKLTARGLVYYEGPAPAGDPWGRYVFRGVDDPAVPKGPIERNIIDIYRYQGSLRRP
ncbi:MAG: DUF2723 domain-containing protein [Nitrospirae bacterium]|nr:DUF2723 domain-containing protein [Nitrospirota bacterium]